jgi:hypothetical protein
MDRKSSIRYAYSGKFAPPPPDDDAPLWSKTNEARKQGNVLAVGNQLHAPLRDSFKLN